MTELIGWGCGCASQDCYANGCMIMRQNQKQFDPKKWPDIRSEKALTAQQVRQIVREELAAAKREGK